jgi:predicted phosphodiesterase
LTRSTVEHRFALLADLHLSDLSATSAHRALQWAVELVNRERPDFLAVAGDVTTYGTARSITLFLEELRQIEVPVFFTPGNAELRSPEGIELLAELCAQERRAAVLGDLLAVFPDTSTGKLSGNEREWLERCVADHSEAQRRIVVTHFPLDRLEEESRGWLRGWMVRQRVELLVAGHTHVNEVRRCDGWTEVITRGLDPDKAIGDLPGINFLTSVETGMWKEEFHPWQFSVDLLPADLPISASPVGWSIHGCPVQAAEETLASGLSCLELRPRNLEFSRRELADALGRLRDQGPLFLSYHLPNLTWNAERGEIGGEAELRAHLDRALEAEVDSLTMHVPRVAAPLMEDEGGATMLYGKFVELYARFFEAPVRAGVHLSIENLHNGPRTPVEDPERKFATTIDEYLRWLDALEERIPRGRIGAHLDVGHARNNGGPLDNLQPLGDWYARLGRRILGYHIHQVGAHPETGKLANHLEISSLFGRRISYAGLLHAWSCRQITRAPLFVEVREGGARRSTAERLRKLFERAGEIRESAELPDRTG